MKYILVLIIVTFFDAHSNAQWTPLNIGTSNYLLDMYFLNDSCGYVNDENGNLYTTTDYGSSWINISSFPGMYIYFLSVDTGFETYYGLGIYKTVNGGVSWNNVLQTQNLISSFSFTANKNIGYASATNSMSDTIIIYKSIDRGNTWFQISSFNSVFELAIFTSIYFTSPDTGYLTGDGIRKTTDGGLNWVVQYDSIGWKSIIFPTPDVGYAAGSGAIIKTTNGQDWINLPQTNFAIFYSVVFTSSDNGYAVGEDAFGHGLMITTNDGGLNWITVFNNTDACWKLFFPSPNIGYTCGAAGSIYRYQSNISVEELEWNNVTLYPNPSSGKFNISNLVQKNIFGKIKIFNSFGSLIKEVDAFSGFDLSEYGKGVYFAEILDEKIIKIKKLIVN